MTKNSYYERLDSLADWLHTLCQVAVVRRSASCRSKLAARLKPCFPVAPKTREVGHHSATLFLPRPPRTSNESEYNETTRHVPRRGHIAQKCRASTRRRLLRVPALLDGRNKQTMTRIAFHSQPSGSHYRRLLTRRRRSRPDSTRPDAPRNPAEHLPHPPSPLIPCAAVPA